MTPTRELAAKLAAAVFDRIERDRTLILQTIEDELHSALLLHDAEQKEMRQAERKGERSPTDDNPYRHVRYLRPLPDGWAHMSADEQYRLARQRRCEAEALAQIKKQVAKARAAMGLST